MAERGPLKGYSHNVRYKARAYHVQTEDSGVEEACIITHLFLDGLIVSALRTPYLALLQLTDGDERICAMMKEQHKQILRQLRRGDLDHVIGNLVGAVNPQQRKPPSQPAPRIDVTPPPALDGMSPAEVRAVRRGTQISKDLAPLTGQPDGEIPIPLDHPAFSGIPMIEWESDSGDSLELDLESINGMELDKPALTKRKSGPGHELELDTHQEDDAFPSPLAADPMRPVIPSFVTPVPPRPVVDEDVFQPDGDTPPAPDAPKPPQAPRAPHPPPFRTKTPSLPLPRITEKVDESMFDDPGRAPKAPKKLPKKLPRPQQSAKTMTFPAPFKSPEQVEEQPEPSTTKKKD